MSLEVHWWGELFSKGNRRNCFKGKGQKFLMLYRRQKAKDNRSYLQQLITILVSRLSLLWIVLHVHFVLWYHTPAQNLYKSPLQVEYGPQSEGWSSKHFMICFLTSFPDLYPPNTHANLHFNDSGNSSIPLTHPAPLLAPWSHLACMGLSGIHPNSTPQIVLLPWLVSQSASCGVKHICVLQMVTLWRM